MRARRMITARRAVTGTALACSAVLIAALLGVPSQAHPGPASAAGGATPPTAASLAAERLLRSAASAPVTVTRDAQGLAHAVGTTAGHPVARPAGVAPTGSDERLARVHLAPLGALFGLADPAAALRVVPADAALAGAPGADRIVRFQQVRDGVPVLGGELVVVLDAHGALRSITGETLPSPAGAARAPVTVTAAQARATAMAAVRRAHPEVVPAALRASAPERWYLDPELIGAPATLHLPTGPVWRTEVTDRGSVRRMVLVDARTGSVPLNLGLIHSAVPRVICDRINREDTSEAGSDCVKPYARASARTSGTGQVDTAFDYTADAEEFYARVLGGDLSNLIGSDAGDGKKLRSTVRYCPPGLCETVNGTVLFDNAFWNGRGMFYGDGWEQADDIVAHELTHGVVEKTARLLYFYQSGAINESFSDIFGELVDLSNGVDGPNLQGDWRIGEDAPGDYGPTRNMASPTSAFFAQPDRMTSGIYDSDVLFQDNGGVHGNSGVGNKAAFLIADGGSFNGQSIAGIGRNPAAKLFYRTLRMLTSGSDYADFGVALNQACADLKLGAAACDTVRKAVLATEMAKAPTAGAAAPEAAVCPSGSRKASVLTDSFEAFSAKRWSLGGQWQLINDYARTGRFSLYGVEPDRSLSSAATLKKSITVPRGVKTYLRFAHQYRLDHGLLETGLVDRYYDGAVLEYRVGSGSWKSASDRTWENGPVRRISPNPGARYKAFGGDSHGYGSARLDLKFLAGKKAQFRWKVIGDRSVAFDGWTIDDVSVYACGTTKPSDVRGLKVKVKNGAATVSWSPPVYKPKSGLSGYKVIRKGGGATKQTLKVGAGARSAKFTGLQKGATYKFVVIPQSTGGAGPETTSKAVTAK